MPDEHDETRLESDMEELTISQAAAEFRIKRNTLNNWVWQGKIPARKEFSDLGVEYYKIKRGDLANFLRNRHNFGRPLGRA